MRVAVIGGSGFIGSFLIRKLVEEGYDTINIDIRRGSPDVEFYLADIRILDQVISALEEVDLVFHLAGTVFSVARRNPYLSGQLDIYGTLNVLEACLRSGVDKLIYASSFYVYDGLPKDMVVDESHRSDIFKAEMFGVAKLVGERLVLEYHNKYGLNYVILRFGPVYGPHERCSCVVYEFIKEGLAGRPIVVWGKGQRKNQYTYVEDIANGAVKAMKHENEIFNLICPEYRSISEIAELLRSKYGFEVVYDLSKREGPSMPYISAEKAMKVLGWKPIGLEEGIEKTIKALEEGPKGSQGP